MDKVECPWCRKVLDKTEYMTNHRCNEWVEWDKKYFPKSISEKIIDAVSHLERIIGDKNG